MIFIDVLNANECIPLLPEYDTNGNLLLASYSIILFAEISFNPYS